MRFGEESVIGAEGGLENVLDDGDDGDDDLAPPPAPIVAGSVQLKS